jgi:hypothetical protein
MHPHYIEADNSYLFINNETVVMNSTLATNYFTGYGSYMFNAYIGYSSTAFTNVIVRINGANITWTNGSNTLPNTLLNGVGGTSTNIQGYCWVNGVYTTIQGTNIYQPFGTNISPIFTGNGSGVTNLPEGSLTTNGDLGTVGDGGVLMRTNNRYQTVAMPTGLNGTGLTNVLIGSGAPTFVTNATALVSNATFSASSRNQFMAITFTTSSTTQAAMSNYFTFTLSGTGTIMRFVVVANPASPSNSVVIVTPSAPSALTTYGLAWSVGIPQ